MGLWSVLEFFPVIPEFLRHGTGFFLAVGPLGAGLVIQSRIVMRRIERTGGAMCLRCQYDLAHAVADAQRMGVCPECGEAFDLDYNRRVWRTTFETR